MWQQVCLNNKGQVGHKLQPQQFDCAVSVSCFVMTWWTQQLVSMESAEDINKNLLKVKQLFLWVA